MGNFKNGIQIDINLTDESKLISELQSTIGKLEKEANLTLNLDTKSATNNLKELDLAIQNINKSLKGIDFSNMSTVKMPDITKNMNQLSSVFNTFAKNAGIDLGDELAKGLEQEFMSAIKTGNLKNFLDSAIDKNIEIIDKQILQETATELQQIESFLREINVLRNSKAKGQSNKLVSAGKSLDISGVLDKTEIKDLRPLYGQMLKLKEEGIKLDGIIDEWADSAAKFGLELSRNASDAAYQLANFVQIYREYQKGIRSKEQSIYTLNDGDKKAIENQTTASYEEMLFTLKQMGYEIDGNNFGIKEQSTLLSHINQEIGEQKQKVYAVNQELNKQEQTVSETKAVFNDTANVIKEVEDSTGNLVSRSETFKNDISETVQHMYTLNSETGEIEKITKTIVKDKDKEAAATKEIDELVGQILLKSNELRKKGLISDSSLNNVATQLTDIEKKTNLQDKLTSLKDLNKYMKELSIDDKNLSKAEGQFLDISKKATTLGEELKRLQSKFANVITTENQSDIDKYSNKLNELKQLADRARAGEVIDANRLKKVNSEIQIMGDNLKNSLSHSKEVSEFENQIAKVSAKLEAAFKNDIIDVNALNKYKEILSNITFDNKGMLDNFKVDISGLTKAEKQFLDITLQATKFSNELDTLKEKSSKVVLKTNKDEIKQYSNELNKFQELANKASQGEVIDPNKLKQTIDNIKLLGSELKSNLTESQKQFDKNNQEAETFKNRVKELQAALKTAYGNDIIKTSSLDKLQNSLNNMSFDNQKGFDTLSDKIFGLDDAEKQFLKVNKEVRTLTEGLRDLKSNFKDVITDKNKNDVQEYGDKIKELKKVATSISTGKVVDNNSIQKLKNDINIMGRSLKNNLSTLQADFDKNNAEVDKFNTKINTLQNTLSKAFDNGIIDTSALNKISQSFNKITFKKQGGLEDITAIINNLETARKQYNALNTTIQESEHKLDKLKNQFKDVYNSTDSTNLNKYINSLNQLKDMQAQVNLGVIVDDESIKKVKDSLSLSSKMWSDDLHSSKKIYDDVEKVKKVARESQTELDNLTNKFNNVIDTHAQQELNNYQHSMQELNDIIAKFINGEQIDSNVISKSLDNIKASSKELKSSLSNAQAELLQVEKIEDGLKRLQKELNSLGDYLDTDFITVLQNRINSITTDNAKEEISKLTTDIGDAKAAENQIRQLQNQISKMETIASKAQNSLKNIVDNKATTQLNNYTNEINKAKNILAALKGSGKGVNINVFADMKDSLSDMTKDMDKTEKKLSNLMQLQEKWTADIKNLSTKGIYDTSSLDQLQKKINTFNTDTMDSEIQNTTQKLKDLNNNISKINTAKLQVSNMLDNKLINEDVLRDLQAKLNNIDATKAQNEINELINRTNSLATTSQANINKVQKQYDSLSSKLENVKTKFANVLTNKEIQEVTEFDNKLKQLQTTLNNLKMGAGFDPHNIAKEMNSASQAAANMEVRLKELSSIASSSGNAFSEMFNSIKNYAAMYVGFHEATQSIRNGIAHVIEVEDSLVNLRRIYEMTDQQAQTFTQTISNQAKALAMDTFELMDIVTMYTKLGYSIQEAQSMAQTTQKFDFAADIGNIEESAKALVSTIKGFGMDASDITTIADAIDQVGNNFAVNASDINEVLRVSSATLGTFNNSLNESITLGTVAQEIINNASTVGNALKSLGARITTNENALNVLQQMNISIENMDGTLKSTYDIMTEVGQYWETMPDTIDKASYANDLFGKNHISTGLAIINNYDKLKEVMDSIDEGAGIVDREFDTRLDSTSAKVAQLKQTINQMWEGMINSNFTKSVVDALIVLVETLGNIPGILSIVTSAFLIFKGNALTGVTQGVVAFGGSLKTLLVDFKNVGSALLHLPTTISTISTAMAGATGVAGKLSAAFAALNLSTGGIGLAIAAAAAVVTIGAKAWKDYQNRFEEASKALKEEVESLNYIKTNYEDITNITQKLQDPTTSAEERNSLVELNQKIIELYPELIAGYNAELDIFDISIEKLEQLKQKKSEATVGQSSSLLSDVTKEIDKYEQKIAKAQENIAKQEDIIANGTNVRIVATAQQHLKQYQEELQKYQEKITGLRGEEAQAIREINSLLQSYVDSGLSLDAAKEKLIELGASTGSVDIAVAKAGGKIESSFDKIMTSIDKATNKTDGMKAAIQALNNNVLDEKIVAVLNNKFPELGLNIDNAKAKVAEFRKELANAAQEGEESLNGLGNSVNDAMKIFSVATTEIDSLRSQIETLNKEQTITPALIQQIADKYPEIGAAILDVGDTIDFLNDKIEDQVRVQEEAFAQMVADDENFYKQKILNNNNFEAHINEFLNRFVTNSNQNYNIDFDNYSTLQQLKEGAMDSLGVAVDNWMSQYVDVMAEGYDVDYNNFKSLATAKAEVLKAMLPAQLANSWLENDTIALPQKDFTVDEVGAYESKVQEALKSLEGIYAGGGLNLNRGVRSSFGSIGSSGIGSSGRGSSNSKSSADREAEKAQREAEKAAQEAEKWREKIAELNATFEADMYFEVNRALEEINNELTNLETAKELVTDGSIEHSAMLLQEIELLERKKDAILAVNKTQHKEAEELQGYLSKYQFYFDQEGKLINHQQRLIEIQKTVNAMAGDTEAAYNKKKEYVEWVKELEEKTSRYNQLMQTELPKSAGEWNKLGNEIKNVQKTIEEAHTSLVKNLRDSLVSVLMKQSEEIKEELDKKQEKAEEALEKEYNAKVEKLKNQIEYLKKQLKDLDDTETDKRKKLAALEEEMKMWQKDDSVYASKKISELQEQIAALKKEIKKDELNAEVDDLEQEITNEKELYDKKLEQLKKQYEDELEELKKKNKVFLKEQEAYAYADKLIRENQQKDIIDLLTNFSDTYKDVGTLLGKSFSDAFTKEVQEGMNAFNALMNKTNLGTTYGTSGGISSGNSSSGASSSSATNGTEYIWVEDGANTRVFTDSTGTKVKGTLWQTGYASADKLVKGQYKNGFYEIFDQNGNSIGWVERPKVRKWYDSTAQFAEGGRTPNNIDDGRMAVLHSNEAILNANDTQKLDDIHGAVQERNVLALALSKLPALITGIFDTTKEYLNNLSILQQDAMDRTVSVVNPIDYNGILSAGDTVNNNTTESNSIVMNNEINVTNNTKNDSNFNARSLEKMFKKQASRFR